MQNISYLHHDWSVWQVRRCDDDGHRVRAAGHEPVSAGRGQPGTQLLCRHGQVPTDHHGETAGQAFWFPITQRCFHTLYTSLSGTFGCRKPVLGVCVVSCISLSLLSCRWRVSFVVCVCVCVCLHQFVITVPSEWIRVFFSLILACDTSRLTTMVSRLQARPPGFFSLSVVLCVCLSLLVCVSSLDCNHSTQWVDQFFFLLSVSLVTTMVRLLARPPGFLSLSVVSCVCLSLL